MLAEVKEKEIRGVMRGVLKSDVLSKFDHSIHIAKIYVLAAEQAQNTTDEEVSDEPVDPDWATHWHQRAGNVSNEEVQLYWARILAGEIKQPGSFSLHTLDLLSRMSREDVELVDRAARLQIETFIYWGPPGNDEFSSKTGLSFNFILSLSELGVTSGTSRLTLLRTLEKNTINWIFKSHNRIVGISHSTETTEVKAQEIIKLTQVGQELCSLATGYKVNEEYLQAFARSLKSENINVMIGDIRARPGQPGDFEGVNPVEV